MRNNLDVFLVAMMMIVLVSPTWAVKTVYVEQSSEKDFKAGEFVDLSINSQGKIELCHDILTLDPKAGDEWVINDMLCGDDGDIYIATSGEGLIYKLKADGSSSVIYGDKDGQAKHIFTLAKLGDGSILAGCSGDEASLLKIRNDKAETIWSDQEIKYVWDIVVGPSGQIYLATGPQGKVLTIGSGSSEAELLYEAAEDNILALALDKDGVLYAGGDQFGMVYRIEPGSKKTTVLYDTGHKEISNLLFDGNNNLYIGTADATAAKPGNLLILSDDDTSMPAAEGEKDDSVKETATADKTSPAATKSDTTTQKTPSKPSKPSAANSVYKITPSGYVTEVFNKPVAIISMVFSGKDELLLGTGNDGKLLKLNVVTLEAVEVYAAEPSAQISALVVNDKDILAGCANPAKLVKIKEDYRTKGTYISDVIDAGQPSKWGTIQISSQLPTGCKLMLATRSGNSKDPKKQGWQDWSEPEGVKDEFTIGSEVGRFLQYKFIFESDGKASPVVETIRISHMIPNLPPLISDLEVVADKGNAKNKTVSWKASDANGDSLVYELFMKQKNWDDWISIVKDLATPKYAWVTTGLPDGQYQIKVVANDKNSNTPGDELDAGRVSSAVVIDNTAPVISSLSGRSVGGMIEVAFVFEDSISVAGEVHYAMDSTTEWVTVLPVDGILDSRVENIKFEIKPEEAGSHIVLIRASDALGNMVYRALKVNN
ncbi:MAG: hypothetical protein JEZ07_02490 [Phycisphaerae bacterium]|nr:hypothetical protein [Phycisphaerae bacterium]